jgi:hypothetical protein
VNLCIWISIIDHGAFRRGVAAGKDAIRCPACGTLESCGCASPGWTYIHKDVEAQGLQLLPDKRVAAPKGAWLDDQGRIVVLVAKE